MSVATPARIAAHAVLVEADRRDAYARDVMATLPALQGLDPRDVAFVRRLVLGVVATRGCLDELCNRFCRHPRQVSARVRAALRLGAFELVYLGTAPSVAVSQAVELVRRQARAACGLVNAVLRRVAEARDGYLAARDVEVAERTRIACARRAGLPVWLEAAIEGSLGPVETERLCAAALEPAPIAAQFVEGYDLGLLGDAVEPMSPAGLAAGGIVPEGFMAVRDLPRVIKAGALSQARAVVSDLHAQQIAAKAVRSGTCLELGAGRGTKTFVMASIAQRRHLARTQVALDLYPAKCRINRERLERAGLAEGIEVVAGDATDLDRALHPLDRACGERRLFDTVLLDAPCSGTGTMRRHPEIPWRLAPEDIHRELPALQARLLSQAAVRLAPGGQLIYATCSVLARENDAVVDELLAGPEGAGLTLVERHQDVPVSGGYDGHYHAVLQRMAER